MAGLHQDLAAEPSLTAAEAAELLAIEVTAAPHVLSWRRTRGMLLAIPQRGITDYPRFQFDRDGRRLHRIVTMVNICVGAGTDPYTAAWWLRPGSDGRRPRDLVATDDEGLLLDWLATDINRHVLTLTRSAISVSCPQRVSCTGAVDRSSDVLVRTAYRAVSRHPCWG